MDFDTDIEGWFPLLKQTQNKLRQLSKQQLAELNLYIDSIQNTILRELPENIDYFREKQSFLDKQKDERTKRFYNNALARWEKCFSNRNKEKKKMKIFWEIDERIINSFISSYLLWYSDCPYPPTAISTIKRDLAVYFSFYNYLETKYILQPIPAHYKKSFYEQLKRCKENRPPKTVKPCVPSLAEIKKICQRIDNKSTLFAVEMAYRHGFLPKDLEQIRVEGSYLIFENGRRLKLVSELRKLAVKWQEEIDRLEWLLKEKRIIKNIEKGDIHSIIADRVRKLTKDMKEKGNLEYAYTLTDIKRYFTYDIARIESLVANNQSYTSLKQNKSPDRLKKNQTPRKI
jgi:hypothetical protein